MAIDLAAIKRRQQATWASGDYHMIGTSIVIVSEQLVDERRDLYQSLSPPVRDLPRTTIRWSWVASGGSIGKRLVSLVAWTCDSCRESSRSRQLATAHGGRIAARQEATLDVGMAGEGLAAGLDSGDPAFTVFRAEQGDDMIAFYGPDVAAVTSLVAALRPDLAVELRAQDLP